uniref:Non-specific serine/threonine protein kinase n=1 Tax=Panagrellus redivivus TaxID=6233 RepID=A0A7E4W3V0_PANRE
MIDHEPPAPPTAVPSTSSSSGNGPVQVIVTTDPVRGNSTVTSSVPPDPRKRLFTRRTSHTLLIVPEQRRVSTVSGMSVTSCPTELAEDGTETSSVNSAPTTVTRYVCSTNLPNRTLLNTTPCTGKSLSASPPDHSRRKSVQVAGPMIGFRPKRCFERRASQPTISIHPGMLPSGSPMARHYDHSMIPPCGRMMNIPPSILNKKVSWLSSMKSLQDGTDALNEVRSRLESMTNGSIGTGGKPDSTTNSMFGSAVQLNETFDLESDTPPMDTLSWSGAGALTLHPDQIIHDLKHALNDIDNRDLNEVTTSLWNVYIKYRDKKDCKDEFIADFVHRTGQLLDILHISRGCRYLDVFARFVNKCITEFDETLLFEELNNVLYTIIDKGGFDIHERCIYLIGKVLEHSIKNVNNPENEEFPSVLGKEVFTELYTTLVHFVDYDKDFIRQRVIQALHKLQDYPKLMEDVADPTLHPRNLIAVCLFDPSEDVRRFSVESFAFGAKTNNDGELLLRVLLYDPSPALQQQTAVEISQQVPITVFSSENVRVIFNSPSLFLGDKIIPAYYGLLLAWSKDCYCYANRLNPDADITVEQHFEGIFQFLMKINYTAEMHQIVIRMFHHMRMLNKLDVLKFVRVYVDATPLVSIGAMNLKTVFDSAIDGDNLLASLSLKLRRIVMWYSMVTYACSHAIPEPIRIEARLMLLPTMSEYSKILVDIWKKFGELSQLPEVSSSSSIIMKGLLNTMTCLFVVTYEFLESEECGKSEWLKAITTVLADTSFPANIETVAAVVKNWLIYHLDALSDPEHASNLISDYVYELVPPECNGAQEDENLEANAPPPPMKRFAKEHPVMFARIVRILTSIFTSGVFKNANPVLQGLATNFFTVANNALPGVEEDVCIAMTSCLPLFKENSCLMVARLAFAKPDATHVHRICLIMLHDSIVVNGIKKTNEVYFSEDNNLAPTNEGAFDPNGNVENLFLHFLDNSDKALASLANSCLLQFIMFDYVDDFKNSMMALLIRAFMKTLDDQNAIIIRLFFIHFCSVSREHQCRVAIAYANIIRKLKNDSTPEVTRIKVKLTSFVVDLTCYNCLKPDAIDREFGTAHTFLAKQLFKIVFEGNLNPADFKLIVEALSNCEVTEIVEHKLLKELRAMAEKAEEHVNTPRTHKPTFYGMVNRFKTAMEYIYNRKIPSVVMPTRTIEQIKKELGILLKQVTSHNERKYAHPWIEDNEEQPQMGIPRSAVVDDVPSGSSSSRGASNANQRQSNVLSPPKIKIWNERKVTSDDCIYIYSLPRKCNPTN